MTRTRPADAGQYTLRQRARAFVSGLADFEPLLSVAREGLRQEGLSQDRRLDYALRIAESGSSSCAGIADLIRTLSSGPLSQPNQADPYRSAPVRLGIPPHVQDRLCELYRSRYDEAMESFLEAERGAGSTENASLLVDARTSSRMDKASAAYMLLKGGSITSIAARRHLTAVFCDAAKDVLSGGLFSNPDAERIREAIISEFRGEGLRAIIPYGIGAYEAGRMLSVVSKALCDADMSFVPPRR